MMDKIHTDEFFFHTSDQILKELHKNQDYEELYSKAEKQTAKFPFIEKLFHNDDMKGNQIGPEELEALQTYIDLKYQMENLIELEHYFRGRRDSLLYLIRCGIL